MKLRISVKFFLMFFLFAAVTLGGFSFFLSLYFSRILVNREISSFQGLTTSFLAQTENEIRTMDDASINIFYSGMIQDRFLSYLNDTSENLESYTSLLELFVALNGANFSLPLISIYSNGGDRVSMGAYSTRERVDLPSLPWVEETKARECRKYLSLPYSSSMMKSSQRTAVSYISLFRTFRDERGNDIGYIETAQYCADIFQSILTYIKRIDENLQVYVFNEYGEGIYPFEGEKRADTAGSDYYALVQGREDAQIRRNGETGRKELLFAQASAYTGWTYVCVQDMNSILRPVKLVSRILLWVTLLALVVISVISYYLSSGITRPIRELLDRIHATSLDTLSGEKHHLNSSYNEFDELNDAFHNMSDGLKRSMDELIHSRHRESESRFLALQSQINPHFYYNSLSSIIALTEADKPAEVIRFCTNLSRIMRYAAQNQPGTVPLSDEIKYVREYLYCMKVRYQSSLTYSIEVDPALDGVMIPKLIIQPLLENALKHGTDCAPPWHISLEGEKEEQGWTIRVCDRGKGFSAEALASFEKKMVRFDEQPGGETEETLEGLGLINVYARWRMYAGKAFFFHVENREEGCCVALGWRERKE